MHHPVAHQLIDVFSVPHRCCNKTEQQNVLEKCNAQERARKDCNSEHSSVQRSRRVPHAFCCALLHSNCFTRLDSRVQ